MMKFLLNPSRVEHLDRCADQWKDPLLKEKNKSYKQSCVSTGKGSFEHFMDQLPSFSDIDYINSVL